MSARIYWLADDPTATSFTLTKSVDGGRTFTALGTVAADTTGPNYEAKTRRFFYADGAGEAGHVYAITATGPLGVSDPTLLVAPAGEPKKCLIIGYLRDVFGSVDEHSVIQVAAAQTSRGERWARQDGAVAASANALGVRSSVRNVYVDATGMFQVELVQGALVTITIHDMDYAVQFRVPEENGPVNIRDLRTLRGAELEQYDDVGGERPYFPNS